jgi:hypothetical protein
LQTLAELAIYARNFEDVRAKRAKVLSWVGVMDCCIAPDCFPE